MALTTFFLPSIYRSTATLQIEQNLGRLVSPADTQASAASAQTKEAYQTLVELIKSRSVAERTVRELHLSDSELDDGALTNISRRLSLTINKPGNSKDFGDESGILRTSQILKEQLTVEPVRGSQLVQISIDTTNADLSAGIVNNIVESFIRADRETKANASQAVSQFLDARLSDLRSKVLESEFALRSYRSNRGLNNSSRQAAAAQQAAAANDRLQQARTRRLELEASVKQITLVSSQELSSLPVIARDPAVMDAARQVAAMSQRLAELSETAGPRSTKLLEVKAALESAIETLRQRHAEAAASVRRELQAATIVEQDLDGAVATTNKELSDASAEDFELNRLERDAKSNRDIFDTFLSRAKETSFGADVKPDVARLVEPAIPSTRPIRPKRLQLILVTLLFSLAGTAMVFILIERLDAKARNSQELEAIVKLPVLGAVPKTMGKSPTQLANYLLTQPDSAFAEAIRAVETRLLALLHALRPTTASVVLVTSGTTDDGKTTLTLNLAQALAQSRRVLLIDADVRRPKLLQRVELGPSNESQAVKAQLTALGLLEPASLASLPSLTIGAIEPKSPDWLLSEAFARALSDVRGAYEIVIFDSPPVGVVSDALALTPHVSCVVVVVQAGVTPSSVIKNSINQLKRVNAKAIALVLNHAVAAEPEFH